jgi:hypothetical protein
MASHCTPSSMHLGEHQPRPRFSMRQAERWPAQADVMKRVFREHGDLPNQVTIVPVMAVGPPREPRNSQQMPSAHLSQPLFATGSRIHCEGN